MRVSVKIISKSCIATILICVLLMGCAVNKIPSDEHIVLFEVTQSNWGENSSLDDYWSSFEYIVYYDGAVECTEHYNISGDMSTSYWLEEEHLNELYQLLEGDFQKYNEDYSAADGTGWAMTYYDVEGEEIHSFDGYIYDNETLERIVVLINGN